MPVDISPVTTALAMTAQINARNRDIQLQEQQRQRERKTSNLRNIGAVAGAIGGAIAGGPQGAAAGASLGSTLGGAVGSSRYGGTAPSVGEYVSAGTSVAGAMDSQRTQELAAQQRAAEQSVVQQAIAGSQPMGTPEGGFAPDMTPQQSRLTQILRGAQGAASPLQTAAAGVGLANALQKPPVTPIKLGKEEVLISPDTGKVIARGAGPESYQPLSADQLKLYPGAVAGQINTTTGEVKNLHFPTSRAENEFRNLQVELLNKYRNDPKSLTPAENTIMAYTQQSNPMNTFMGQAVKPLPGLTSAWDQQGQGQTPPAGTAAQPKTQAEYDKLPKGAKYIDPNDPEKAIRIKS